LRKTYMPSKTDRTTNKASHPDYGISALESRGAWLIRIRVRRQNLPAVILAKMVCWAAHGGKEKSKTVAREIRDQLLNDRKRKYKAELGSEIPTRYHQNRSLQSSKAFPRLIGITLSRKGEGAFYIKASCRTAGKNKIAVFPVHKFGVKGAIESAVKFREGIIGHKVYNPTDISRDYKDLIRKFRKDFARRGISLLYEPAPPPAEPLWRTMPLEELKSQLPPAPDQKGMFVSVVEIKGSRHIRLVSTSPNSQFGVLTKSVGPGVWPAFSECLDYARATRSLPRLEEAEKVRFYRKWLRGFTKQLSQIGLDVSYPKDA